MLAEIVWNQNTIAVAGAFAVPITAILGKFWSQVQRHKSDNVLKRQMIDRGMTVEEIERVLAAKTSDRSEPAHPR
jgi:hypothetical protein